MIAYVKSSIDFSTKDILEFEQYAFAQDIEYANKSSITILKKPNIIDDDFVIVKDGNEVIYFGICEDFETDESSGYTINLKQKECFFDRQIFPGTTSLISSTGIEDFIKSEIEANWTASGDTLLDKTYITVVASTHTPCGASVNAEQGVYNLKTFLGNAKEYYGIFTTFTYTDTTLTVTISKDNSTSLPIDVTISDVSGYTETYNVDVLAKLKAKWEPSDEYTWLDYIESHGTEWIDTGFARNGSNEISFDITIKPTIRQVTSQYYVRAGNLSLEGGGTGFGVFNNSTQYTCIEPGLSYHEYGNVSGDKVSIKQSYSGGTITISGDAQATFSSNNWDVTADWNTSNFIIGFMDDYAKIYSVRFYRGSNLERNFIPAKRDSDGVVGLYDFVTETFYTNQGTGAFTAGPQRSYTYFLKTDRTLTTDINDVNRANGVIKSITIDKQTEDEVIQEIYNTFTSNSYEHKITFDLLNTSKAYPPSMYYVGRKATIKTKTGIQTSIITGMNYSSDSAFISFTFGKLRISLIEKIRSIGGTK